MVFRNSLLCNGLSKGVVIGLDAKMKIVYGWYSAENEESSEISKWKKGMRKWRTAGSNPGVPYERLCPLGHVSVRAKSMTFMRFVDV